MPFDLDGTVFSAKKVSTTTVFESKETIRRACLEFDSILLKRLPVIIEQDGATVCRAENGSGPCVATAEVNVDYKTLFDYVRQPGFIRYCEQRVKGMEILTQLDDCTALIHATYSPYFPSEVRNMYLVSRWRDSEEACSLVVTNLPEPIVTNMGYDLTTIISVHPSGVHLKKLGPNRTRVVFVAHPELSSSIKVPGRLQELESDTYSFALVPLLNLMKVQKQPAWKSLINTTNPTEGHNVDSSSGAQYASDNLLWPAFALSTVRQLWASVSFSASEPWTIIAKSGGVEVWEQDASAASAGSRMLAAKGWFKLNASAETAFQTLRTQREHWDPYLQTSDVKTVLSDDTQLLNEVTHPFDATQAQRVTVLHYAQSMGSALVLAERTVATPAEEGDSESRAVTDASGFFIHATGADSCVVVFVWQLDINSWCDPSVKLATPAENQLMLRLQAGIHRVREAIAEAEVKDGATVSPRSAAAAPAAAPAPPAAGAGAGSGAGAVNGGGGDESMKEQAERVKKLAVKAKQLGILSHPADLGAMLSADQLTEISTNIVEACLEKLESHKNEILRLQSDDGGERKVDSPAPRMHSGSLDALDVLANLASRDHLQPIDFSAFTSARRAQQLPPPLAPVEPKPASNGRKKRSAKRPLSKAVRHCHKCNTTTTPKWRKTDDKEFDLCNACGLSLKKKERRERESRKRKTPPASSAAPSGRQTRQRVQASQQQQQVQQQQQQAPEPAAAAAASSAPGYAPQYHQPQSMVYTNPQFAYNAVMPQVNPGFPYVMQSTTLQRMFMPATAQPPASMMQLPSADASSWAQFGSYPPSSQAPPS